MIFFRWITQHITVIYRNVTNPTTEASSYVKDKQRVGIESSK